MHIDDELALNHRQKFEFIHNTWNALFGYNSRFSHLFHCELFRLGFFHFYTPDFAKSTTPNGINLREVCFVQLHGTLFVLARLKVAVTHLCLSLSFAQESAWLIFAI